MNTLTREIHTCLSQLSASEDGKLSARAVFPPGFTGFKGHFPGDPVLPGVCIVQTAVVVASLIRRRDAELKHLVSAKWYAPVRPGEELRFAGDERPEGKEEATLKFRVTRGPEKAAELTLKVVYLTAERNEELS